MVITPILEGNALHEDALDGAVPAAQGAHAGYAAEETELAAQGAQEEALPPRENVPAPHGKQVPVELLTKKPAEQETGSHALWV